MISVLLYGRNDAHGYNLHRRAALSLNCIAEVLTDPDDEIIFVDYNTPDELPTFVEAIADTLTDRCLGLLRVLRVPPAIHRQRFADRTHLPAIEPVSRNAGARRANASNRWLLSTNTDMVLLPLVGSSLSEICVGLPDGFYGLPRFELPEWLWERLPRSDPHVALTEIRRLGSALRLDEPTVSHEWIRFDAPGDFQLILREDFVAVDGFDEEMVLGYHVDSNLSRRMFLRRGSIETLGDQVAGYHCNHNRVPTVYHGVQLVTNDLDRFFYSVEGAALPEQRATWGLAGVTLEEVPIAERGGLGVGDRVASVLGAVSNARSASDAGASGLGLTYDSGHVLPFVADSLAVSPSEVTVGYIGANPVLERLLGKLVTELRFGGPLAAADLDDLGSIDELHRVADVVVVDLGIDASLPDVSPPESSGGSVEFPLGLDRAFVALDRLVELERARLARGEHPRRIVLVNSAAAFWNAYVLAHLDCSHTSVHSRVRRATVKPVPDDAPGVDAARQVAARLFGWIARDRAGFGLLRLPRGARVAIAELDNYRGFGEGWTYPDEAGIWTEGRRARLAVAFEPVKRDAVLTIAVGGVCVGAGESIEVELLVDGASVGVREFRHRLWRGGSAGRREGLGHSLVQHAKTIVPLPVRDRLGALYVRLRAAASANSRISQPFESGWRIRLPGPTVEHGRAELTFVVDEPRSPRSIGWSDDNRELGIHLRALTLEHGIRGALRRRPASVPTGSG